jgi:hypothetical protein
MGGRSDMQPGRLRAPARGVVVRIGQIACALPEGGDQADGLIAEFESLLGAVPAGMRRLLLAGLVAFDHGARLYPGARGRRFTRLADARAEAYFRAVLSARRGGLGPALQRIKALIVFCYYELPEVQREIGYRPGPYIASVSRRRLGSYGEEIRAGERAVFARQAQDAARDEP